MSTRKTTSTTTEPPTTQVVILEETTRKFPLWVVLVVVGVFVLIVICLIVCYYFYRKRKKQAALIAPDTPPEQLGLHPKSSFSSSPVMQQRVFSIDTEQGLSDNEGRKGRGGGVSALQLMNKDPLFSSSDVEDLPSPTPADMKDKDKSSPSPAVPGTSKEGEGESSKKGRGELERSPSKGSFKAVAITARMGASMTKKRREKLAPKDRELTESIEESEESDMEEVEDSGFVDITKQEKEKAAKAALDALKAGKKERRKSILKDSATTVFTTAKKIYEGKQSTFKRTGGRCNSAGTQTSPTGSTISIPGLVETPEPNMDAVFERQANHEPDKDFFVYLISDTSGSSNFRKDCIGRVSLPADKKQVSLSDLRNSLLKAEDVTLRNVLKNNKSFRFVTETYRFVAQPEQTASVNDVYSNLGVYVKLEGAAVNPDALLHTRPDGTSALSMASKLSKFGRKSPSYLAPHRKSRPTRKGHEKGSKSDSAMDEEEENDKHRRSKWYTPVPGAPHRQGGGTSHQSRFMHQDTMTTDSLDHPFGRGRSDSAYDSQQIAERLRQRHFECVSPSRLNYKDAYRRQAPADHFLILEGKRKCDNGGCHNRAIFKCARCIQTAYCSGRCKKEHRMEHSSVCRRPPWRLGAS